MTEFHLPEGYYLEKTKEFIVLRKEGEIVFVQPIFVQPIDSSPERIKEIIEQIEGAIKYVQSLC